MLNIAHILALLLKGMDFAVYCDTSHSSLGAILRQGKKLIAYASTHLKVHEKNYHAYDLELVVAVFAVMIWRLYLYGVRCEVIIKTKSPKYVSFSIWHSVVGYNSLFFNYPYIVSSRIDPYFYRINYIIMIVYTFS